MFQLCSLLFALCLVHFPLYSDTLWYSIAQQNLGGLETRKRLLLGSQAVIHRLQGGASGNANCEVDHGISNEPAFPTPLVKIQWPIASHSRVGLVSRHDFHAMGPSLRSADVFFSVRLSLSS